jgi:hypothetical protein
MTETIQVSIEAIFLFVKRDSFHLSRTHLDLKFTIGHQEPRNSFPGRLSSCHHSSHCHHSCFPEICTEFWGKRVSRYRVMLDNFASDYGNTLSMSFNTEATIFGWFTAIWWKSCYGTTGGWMTVWRNVDTLSRILQAFHRWDLDWLLNGMTVNPFWFGMESKSLWHSCFRYIERKRQYWALNTPNFAKIHTRARIPGFVEISRQSKWNLQNHKPNSFSRNSLFACRWEIVKEQRLQNIEHSLVTVRPIDRHCHFDSNG